MLLLHQIGAVRVAENVRYTVTYTPSLDRILPPPQHLHVKIRNTSSIPLRAAYLHGPYTLYVSCYPSTFDPNQKQTDAGEVGEPAYEPQLKAGGSWSAKLTVPESVRSGAGLGQHEEGHPRPSFTWIIEIASQVLFSTSAAVHYELLVGRDEKSVSLGFTGVVSSHGAPGRVEDNVEPKNKHTAMKGVFTKAVKVKVQDTAALWGTPAFPSLDDGELLHARNKEQEKKIAEDSGRPRKRRKKIHLVILTHGLHSNLGADMLYMKESIDATAKKARGDARQAKADVRKQKAEEQNDFGRIAAEQRTKSVPDLSNVPTNDSAEPALNEGSDEEDDDDEQVLVRGFNGNAVRTERGIQYLGKRLAKYVLSITYPDQPFLPVKSTITQSIARTFTGAPKPSTVDGKEPAHKNSSIAKDESFDKDQLAYQITSISFIGHSLGGVVQTYAIAYIQKHSPDFFSKIRPINFVAMASPFLGLSNENPMYVKFALDFGLVGRTGQDLGLTWRAPTIARNGWGAMVGPFSSTDNKDRQQDPGTKPLLRILPTGPAHLALKRFRNRSVYSNVVNDGVVPLRTSCLLFLDWRGLGKVEKARRDNGLIGTMVNWGVNEIIGTNASAPRRGLFEELFSDSGDETNKPVSKVAPDPASAVPQAEASTGLDQEQYDAEDEDEPGRKQSLTKASSPAHTATPTLWSSLTNFFRPQAGTQKQPSAKQQRILQRGQIMQSDEEHETRKLSADHSIAESGRSSPDNHRKLLVRGASLYTNSSDNENLEAPPKTTVFESAGDLLNPPLPSKEFIMDPEARPRTIFHDRVYHPEDIPPPPTKRQRSFMRSRPGTSENDAGPDQAHEDTSRMPPGKVADLGAMRIEEKIARAYHKDMAWRKVLVRLEPDAHNNIIVRRMFANAYGWPVVKHMCDTHFAYTAAAVTADEDEAPVERAVGQDAPASKEGEQVRDQTQPPNVSHLDNVDTPHKAVTTDSMPEKDDREIDTLHSRQKNLQVAKRSRPQDVRSPSELRESRDHVSDLVSNVSAQAERGQSYASLHSGTAALHRLSRSDSGRWSDKYFESSGDEDENDQKDLDDELQKAYDRGMGHQQPKLSSSPQSTRSSQSKHGGTRPRGASFLPETESTGTMVAEPDSISRRASKDSEAIAAGYPDPQTLSLSGVGIRSSLRNSIVADDDASQSPAKGEGVVEQVARVSLDSKSRNSRSGHGEHKDSLD